MLSNGMLCNTKPCNTNAKYSRQMPTIELRINVILRLLVTFYHFPPSFKNHGPAAIEFRDAVQIQTVAGKYNVTKSK